MCTSPLCIRNRRTDFIPGLHRATLLVPCGHCADCKQQHIDEYVSRILYMIYKFGVENTLFITLTYNTPHLPRCASNGQPCFNQAHINTLTKKLRKKYNKPNEEPKIAYFVASEYGGDRHRPHYHMMLHHDASISSDKIMELVRSIWTGEETRTGRNTKKAWQYGNLGFVFPSKKDVALGKHHLRHGVDSAFYAAKYAVKDVDYMENLNIEQKTKKYRYEHRYEYPCSHVSRYYGLGIKDLKNIDVINGKYIDPLTSRKRMIPCYVMEYLKYTRYKDMESTNSIQQCGIHGCKSLAHTPYRFGYAIGSLGHKWLSSPLDSPCFRSPEEEAAQVVSDIFANTRIVYRRKWNEKFDQDAYLDSLIARGTEDFSFFSLSPEKEAIYKYVYNGCNTNISEVLKDFGFKGLSDMYEYECYHAFFKWTHEILTPEQKDYYFAKNVKGVMLTPPTMSQEDFDNIVNERHAAKAADSKQRYNNGRKANMIKKMLNPEDLGE